MPVLTAWQDPGCPIPVDYAREALEQIRFLAVEGLLALPRIGVGVGGLLLGTRHAGRITILDSVAIDCSHAEGPPFRLTLPETERALELVRSAGPLTVVGWYCSKTRGPATLNARDLILFGTLCPELWQVALLIRPSTVEASRMALCVRDATGLVEHGPECSLEPYDRELAQADKVTPEALREDAKQVSRTAAVARTAVISAGLPAAVSLPLPEPPAKIAVPELPAAEAPPARTEAPMPLFQFAFPASPAPRSKMRSVGWVLAVSAIVAGSGAAFLTRHDWMTPPPLRLSASDANGHLTIRWNRDAVHGIDRGSLTVNDGGEPHTIPLDSRQLDAGAVEYERKSAHIDALMKAGDVRGQVSFPE